MTIPDLRPCFPHATPLKSYRNAPGHLQLSDPEFFEGCGYATADEAAILYLAAQRHKGHWLEIGAHTGWTGAHIIRGGAESYVGLDPEYGHPMFNKTMDPERFRARTIENMERANPERLKGFSTMPHERRSTCHQKGRVALIGDKSWDFLDSQRGTYLKFDFVFVDGEHEPPYPVVDAMFLLPRLMPDCMVFFHDAIGGPVRAGVEWMRRQGFQVKFYKTAQIMAVAWRGNVTPPEFEPSDTGFNWNRHLNSNLNNCEPKQIEKWIQQGKTVKDLQDP